MSLYSQFAAHYEKVFPFREKTYEFLRRHLPEKGRVLDLGCGPGHYTGRLATEGSLSAWGIDLDPAMIEAARQRYPAARFAVLDLRRVGNLASPFTGAFCLGNVLPHLPADDVARFLHDLGQHLTTGGVLVIQTVNFDRLLPLAQPHRFPDLDAGEGLVFRREYVPTGEKSVRFVTELSDGGEVLFASEETLWPSRFSDLAAGCMAAGFTVKESCGDFAGSAFDPEASGACVMVATRNDR